MSKIIVGVVIPTYNEEQMIADCIGSLEAQTFPEDQMEIVVGDNGSKDSTLKIITDLFPKVKIAKALQCGSGYARNAGILMAQGRYICSTDAEEDRNHCREVSTSLDTTRKLKERRWKTPLCRDFKRCISTLCA